MRLWNLANGNARTNGGEGITPSDVTFVLRGADLFGSIKNYEKMKSRTGKQKSI
jgi:hypothetical protein